MKLIGDEWCYFRNISKLDVFILLAWQRHCFTNFGLLLCLFLPTKRSRQVVNETTVTWTRRIWQFLTWRPKISKTQTPFFALTQQSTSLVMAEVGNLKLDPSALKCQNSFFFFEFLFMHSVAYIDTLKMSLYTSIWNSFTESGINKIWERRWNCIWYSYQKMYYINVPLVFRYLLIFRVTLVHQWQFIFISFLVGACFQGHLRRNLFQLGSYLERFPLKMLGKVAEILIISHHLLIEVKSQLSGHISLECPQWDLINSFSPTILTIFSKMLSWPDDL